MYAGVINRQVVYCCHSVIVVGRTGVAASFSTVDDALRFLAKRGFGFGAVYRHDGSDWDKVELDPIQLLDEWSDPAPPSRS
jgi:hypothetical protein